MMRLLFLSPPFLLFSISGPYLVIWQTVWFCLLQVMHSKLVNGVASLYFLVIFHHEVDAAF